MSAAPWQAAVRPALVHELMRPLLLARDVERGWLGELLGRAAWPELLYPMLAAWTAQWSASAGDDQGALPIVHARPPVRETTTHTTRSERVSVPMRRSPGGPAAAPPRAQARLQADVRPTATPTSPPSASPTSASQAAPRRAPSQAPPPGPPAREPPVRSERALPRVVAAFRKHLSESTGHGTTPRREPTATSTSTATTIARPDITPVAASTAMRRAPVPAPAPASTPAVTAAQLPLAEARVTAPADRRPTPPARPGSSARTTVLEDMSPDIVHPRATTLAPPPTASDAPPVPRAAARPTPQAVAATADPAAPAAPRATARPRVTARPAAPGPVALHRDPAAPGRPSLAQRGTRAVAARWSGESVGALATPPRRVGVSPVAAAELQHPRSSAAQRPDEPRLAGAAASRPPVPSASSSPPAPPPPPAPAIDVDALVETVERRLARELGRARAVRRALR